MRQLSSRLRVSDIWLRKALLTGLAVARDEGRAGRNEVVCSTAVLGLVDV